MRRWSRASKKLRYVSRIWSALTGRQSRWTACPRILRRDDLLQTHVAEIPGGVRRVQYGNNVRRPDEVRLVPHPRDCRAVRDDLLVDVGPRLSARRVTGDRLRLVHGGVQGLVV